MAKKKPAATGPKKFEVQLPRRTECSQMIEVEAESKAAAEALVKGMIERNEIDEADWGEDFADIEIEHIDALD